MLVTQDRKIFRNCVKYTLESVKNVLLYYKGCAETGTYYHDAY